MRPEKEAQDLRSGQRNRQPGMEEDKSVDVPPGGRRGHEEGVERISIRLVCSSAAEALEFRARILSVCVVKCRSVRRSAMVSSNLASSASSGYSASPTLKSI